MLSPRPALSLSPGSSTESGLLPTVPPPAGLCGAAVLGHSAAPLACRSWGWLMSILSSQSDARVLKHHSVCAGSLIPAPPAVPTPRPHWRLQWVSQAWTPFQSDSTIKPGWDGGCSCPSVQAECPLAIEPLHLPTAGAELPVPVRAGECSGAFDQSWFRLCSRFRAPP